MLSKKTVLLAIVSALQFVGLPLVSAQMTRLNVGYSATSGDQLPAWVAKDSGIFAKNGLDVQVIFFTGGTTAVLALVSGDVPIAQISGPGVVNSVLAGSDAVFVAAGIVSLNYVLMGKPGVKAVEQMKVGTIAISWVVSPVAAGIVSVRRAAILLVVLSFIGLAVLVQLDPAAQAVALGSLLLVAAYPFMKRITWWPQAWLGLTFNWGVLVGFAAVAGPLTVEAGLLYAAGLFWTLGYDTIYAMQDIEDDALVGIRSSARRLGPLVRAGVALFYALAAALLLAVHPHWALLPAIAHLAWQVARLPDDPLALFRSNALTGALVAAGLLA